MKRIPPFRLLFLVGCIEIAASYFIWLYGSIRQLDAAIPTSLVIGIIIGLVISGYEIQRYQALKNKGEVFKGISFAPHFTMYLLLFAVISVDNRLMWLALITKGGYMLSLAMIIWFLQIRRNKSITWAELLG